MSRSNPSVSLIDVDIPSLEEEFYKKTYYFSYSSLQKLLYSPRLFYSHYVLDQREDRLDAHLVEGSVIHCLLLENGSFEKQFIVSPSKVPVGNNRSIIDKLFYLAKQTAKDVDNVSAFSTEILEILKEINLHQSLKTDQQRLDKILTEENISYYQFLKEKGDRSIIDEETLVKCKEAVQTISSNTRVRKLLHLDCEDAGIDICNECEIKVEPDKYKFGFKGKIDNHIVDHASKTIYINDLKNTGKVLSDFPEGLLYFRYDIQAAIYMYMITKKYNIDSTWKIIFNFIVVDKYQQVYCFEVSKPTMKLWMDKLRETMVIADWHYSNKSFDLPHMFCVGQVML